MPYHLDDTKISLNDLQRRIETTDLVPSRISLLNNLEGNLNCLEKQGLQSLHDLRKAIKTPKKIETVAQATGIEKEYLVLLRREIESYFPKPFPLKRFDWLPDEDIQTLEDAGIKNSRQFYERCIETEVPEKAVERINPDTCHQLQCQCDSVRMQWTSPLAARMFYDAGYDSVQQVAASDPERMCNALREINAGNRYFKGNIGLRDIQRLVTSASYFASKTKAEL